MTMLRASQHNNDNEFREVVLRLLQVISDAATSNTTTTVGAGGDTNTNPGGSFPGAPSLNGNATSTGGSSSGGGMPNSAGGGSRQAYEFFAFLLWYLLLVLCCLIPTCCAYRRRRHLEARLSQQQETFDTMQQQNLVFLNNLTQRQNANEAVFREQRCQLVSKAIEETTMTVQDRDIEQRRGADLRPMGSPRPAATMIRNGGGSGSDENGTVINTSGRSLVGTTGAAVVGGLAEEETSALLRLPNDAPNGSRTVPGACAICLNAYERGDRVTWSPMPTCQHAFHQECIIPWLTNKSECPCCRQEFCSLPTMMNNSSNNGSAVRGNRLAAWNRFPQPPPPLVELTMRPGGSGAVVSATDVPTTTTAAAAAVVDIPTAAPEPLSDTTEQLEEGQHPTTHFTTQTESSLPESSSSSTPQACDDALHTIELRPSHNDGGDTDVESAPPDLLRRETMTTTTTLPSAASPNTDPSMEDGVASHSL